MRTVGLPVIRQQRNLTGRNADGDPIQYETMALLVEGGLIGLELEDDWNGIEANTRLHMGTSLSRRLTQSTAPVNLKPDDDEKAIQDIAHHFPQWHRWIDEKIAALSHIQLDNDTQPTSNHRPAARL